MLRIQLKSKIHMACVTEGRINYEGSISLPEDLIRAVDLWEGEKVLVVSNTTGARLETYVLVGKSGQISMNGGSARKIHVEDRISILGFALSEERVNPKKIVCNEKNEIIVSTENCIATACH